MEYIRNKSNPAAIGAGAYDEYDFTYESEKPFQVESFQAYYPAGHEKSLITITISDEKVVDRAPLSSVGSVKTAVVNKMDRPLHSVIRKGHTAKIRIDAAVATGAEDVAVTFYGRTLERKQ